MYHTIYFILYRPTFDIQDVNIDTIPNVLTAWLSSGQGIKIFRSEKF